MDWSPWEFLGFWEGLKLLQIGFVVFLLVFQKSQFSKNASLQALEVRTPVLKCKAYTRSVQNFYNRVTRLVKHFF